MDEFVIVFGILVVIIGIGFYYIRKTIEENNVILRRKIDSFM